MRARSSGCAAYGQADQGDPPEPGCEHYAFAVDISDPQLLHISERWADNAAIAAHFQSAHMAEFNALLGNAKIEALSIKAYEGDFSQTLMGE